jgi:DNA-directed RNA polymerase alpha subunit
MNPQFSEISENDQILKFTLSGINVSLANALRRAILTDIPVVVIKTENYKDNQCNITVNTSRLHNEILKQRLSCIPIHMKELDLLPEKYMLEVDVKNDTDGIIYVTTEDFKIKNKTTNNYLTKEEVRRIFPPCEKTQSFIDFVRLRAKISDTIPGEELKLTADFSVATARESSAFNVVSKCTYGNTPHMEKINEKWQEIEAKLRAQDDVKESDIEFQKRNFYLLDAQRIFVADSFDFAIKTVGVYGNRELVQMASKGLYEKFRDFTQAVESDMIPILNSETTIDNCFDVSLEDEDYTIGKVLEYFLYEKFYMGDKSLSFCGFKKFHPHDTKSVIRIAFADGGDKSAVKKVLVAAAMSAQEVFKTLYKSLPM